MKATELRIGNYVNIKEEAKKNLFDTCSLLEAQVKYLNENQLFKVASVDEDQVRLYLENEEVEFNFDEIEPVELTSEIIKYFGFEGQPSDFYKDKLSICLKGSDSFHKEGRVYFNSWCIKEKQIKYLHKLQNLFFSLTEEELASDSAQL